MATVLIPTALRAFTDENAQVEAEGQTVGEAIEAVAAAYPDIRKHLYDEQGELRSYVNVFVGDEDIRGFGGLSAPVGADGVVTLVPAIAGGAPGAVKLRTAKTRTGTSATAERPAGNAA
jgi:molybdopterin converting factor small subunit